MFLGRASRFVIGFIILASLGLRASAANGQQPPDQPAFRQLANIEVAFPNQLVRGQANIVHVAIQSVATFTGAEVSPSAGVTVTGVNNYKKPELSQNVAWWDVTIMIANDAASGPRSLVLLAPMGRTAPATVVIPNHVPVISDLRIVSAQANRSTVDVQFAAADPGSDLGDLPYVWFTIRCGGEPTVGVVKGKTAGGLVRASIPRPAAAACDLELRASDKQKIDSNTLKVNVP